VLFNGRFDKPYGIPQATAPLEVVKEDDLLYPLLDPVH
jgi:hypothetical protein